MAMMKILHLVDSLEPGGMENGIVNVSTRLDREEFDIHVCCLARRGQFARRMPSPDQVWSLDKPAGFSTAAVAALSRLIERIQPRILHSHNLGPLIYGALASRLGRRVPVIHGEHGQLDRHHLTRKRLWQRKCLYRACTKVHTVSESLRQDLLSLGFDARKIISVTNGVDTDRFRPARDKTLARRRLNLDLSGQGFVLGMVGRFSEFKGHDLLLDAFDQLCETGADFQLLLVGAGGSEEQGIISRLGSSRNRERIFMLGHQAQPERFYQAMDLMVFPSSHEGLSNAVLESMACGVPVLGSVACGNDEAIVDGRDGFLESITTAESLADSIRRIWIDRQNLGKMGQRARQSMLENFSIDTMVNGYRNLYREVVGH